MLPVFFISLGFMTSSYQTAHIYVYNIARTNLFHLKFEKNCKGEKFDEMCPKADLTFFMAAGEY